MRKNEKKIRVIVLRDVVAQSMPIQNRKSKMKIEMKKNRALIGGWFKHVPLRFLGSEKIHDLQPYRRCNSQTQKPYYTNASDVPRSLQSRVSTIQTVVLTADVFQLFITCFNRRCNSQTPYFNWNIAQARPMSVSDVSRSLLLSFNHPSVVLTADVFKIL